MIGAGIAPYSLNKDENSSNLESNITSLENVIKEADYFTSVNAPHAIIKTIQDTSMAPLFNIGDYIGGIKFNINLNKNVNTNECYIIKT